MKAEENKPNILKQFKSVAKFQTVWQSVAADMKLLTSFIVALEFALNVAAAAPSAVATPKPPDHLARIHFIGFNQIHAGAQPAVVRELSQLPAGAALRDQTLEKAARAIAALCGPRPNTASADAVKLIRPLLDDLWRAESYLEVTGPTNSATEWTFAVRLEPERFKLWQTNCTQLHSAFELTKLIGTNRFLNGGFLRGESNSWFVVASLRANNPFSASSVYREIQRSGRPTAAATDYWLRIESRMFSWLRALPLIPNEVDAFDLTLSPRAASLRTQARIMLSKNNDWHLEKWRIPTKTITDPMGSLISFTAVQGIGAAIERQPYFRDLPMTRAPNQLFAWGQSHVPLQIQVAVPVNNSTNYMKRFTELWLNRINTNLFTWGGGQVVALTNRPELQWRGLPFMIPYLATAPEPKDDFLVAGILPVMSETNAPAPNDLLRQLTSRTNLVYYDWEITQGRLAQFRPLLTGTLPLLPVFTTVPDLPANSVSCRWLDAIEPKLGNTVTEVSVQSPRELTLVRNSPMGVNGFELWVLAYWLESANFPHFDFKPGLRRLSPSPAPEK